MGIILDEIPGVKTLENATNVLDHIVSDVGKVIDVAVRHDPIPALGHLMGHSAQAAALLPKLLKFGYKDIIGFAPMQIYHELLTEGLGLDYNKLEHDAKGAIKTVDGMLTFAFALPIVFAGLGSVVHALLGQRASSVFEHLLGKIPEEIGVTWALGQQIDRAFETAVGTAIEEGINWQKQPSRLEWNVLRMMFRQKLIPPEDVEMYLRKLGYPKHLRDLIKKLDTAQLQVGDVANLWRHDVFNRQDVSDYLDKLGYHEDDRNHLLSLYIDNAELQSATTYRSTARELYRAELINEDDYKKILEDTHTPKKEVADDILAIQLEQRTGRIAASVAALKSGFQRGTLKPEQVSNQLAQLGYSGQAIGNLLAAWEAGPLQHPMSAAKVLSYWYSGVITTRQDALDRLMATHLKPDDAAFLLDHPTAGGAKVHKLTPGLVTRAYLDGVIGEGDLDSAYQRAGLTGDSIGYQTGVAKYQRSRQRRPPKATMPLTPAEIREGTKFGLLTPEEGITELTALGYSANDALYLIELTAKGPVDPNAKAAPATFPTLQSAIDFLESMGYTLVAPPDPRIAEAEGVVEQAGYSVQPPVFGQGGGPPTGPVLGPPPFPLPHG